MRPIKNTIPRDKMLRLASELLSIAADHFGNHSCSDLERPSFFSEEEWMRMAAEYEQWNSGGEDEPAPLGDHVAMSWLAVLLGAGEL